VDILRARVAFRERAFVDVLDLAVRFVVVHARVYARVAAVVLLPSVVVTGIVARAYGWAVAWVLAAALAFAAQVPFTVLASRLVFQDRVRARDTLRDAARDLPKMLVLRGLWLVAVGVGSLFFLVPGAWVGTSLLFTGEVVLLERAAIGTAVGRAHRIATSAYADAMLGFATMFVLPLGAMLLADFGGRAILEELLQFRPPAPLLAARGSILAALGLFAVVPYAATVRFFVYLNARTCAEGWDVQTRFAALAARYEEDARAALAAGAPVRRAHDPAA